MELFKTQLFQPRHPLCFLQLMLLPIAFALKAKYLFIICLHIATLIENLLHVDVALLHVRKALIQLSK